MLEASGIREALSGDLGFAWTYSEILMVVTMRGNKHRGGRCNESSFQFSTGNFFIFGGFLLF